MKVLDTDDVHAYVFQWFYALCLIFQGVSKSSRTAFYLRAHRH